MNLNLFGNLGGHGGYQVLTEHIIQSLKLKLEGSFIENVNLYPLKVAMSEDPYVRRSLGMAQDMTGTFKDISLCIGSSAESLNFTGKTRILYPMSEASRLSPATVKRMNLMDQVWVSSTFNRDVFEKAGVKKDKLKILRGGVDTNIFRPLLKSNKHLPSGRRTGLKPIGPEHPFTFLQVGKFENRKASTETVHGFLKAMEDHPLLDSVQLKVKWSTTVRSRSIQQIKTELTSLFLKYPKAARKVHLVDGSNVNMVELYNNSDCLLLPSKSEGIGLPLLEAMACGIPCITTGYGALSDYASEDAGIILENRGLEPVRDPFYGLNQKNDGEWGVVRFQDVTNAILDMIESNPGQREAYSKAARSHSLKFSCGSTGDNILRLLGEC